MGSPGRLAENALAGDSVYPAWTTQMAQSKASHVIIEYHSHDTVADTTTRVRQLIQIAKAAGKKVIVETIGPGYHGGNLSYQQISEAQRAAATAENVPVIDQTSYLEQYLSNTGKTIWDICGDGLHPNPDIYVMKGHYAATQFAAMK
jgi:lysophospholipase L1-like esterase